MKLLKAIYAGVGAAMDFIIAVGTALFILLLVAGYASIGCQKAWLTNTITCNASMILPLK